MAEHHGPPRGQPRWGVGCKATWEVLLLEVVAGALTGQDGTGWTWQSCCTPQISKASEAVNVGLGVPVCVKGIRFNSNPSQHQPYPPSGPPQAG